MRPATAFRLWCIFWAGLCVAQQGVPPEPVPPHFPFDPGTEGSGDELVAYLDRRAVVVDHGPPERRSGSSAAPTPTPLLYIRAVALGETSFASAHQALPPPSRHLSHQHAQSCCSARLASGEGALRPLFLQHMPISLDHSPPPPPARIPAPKIRWNCNGVRLRMAELHPQQRRRSTRGEMPRPTHAARLLVEPPAMAQGGSAWSRL